MDWELDEITRGIEKLKDLGLIQEEDKKLFKINNSGGTDEIWNKTVKNQRLKKESVEEDINDILKQEGDEGIHILAL